MNASSTIRPHTLFKIRTAGIALLPVCALLVSCGNPSNLASKSLDKVTGLWPSRVPIAKVRPQDLKKMPSGADRALAWNRHLNQWVFVPMNYNPATLPDAQTLPIDGGLLPPLQSGETTILNGQGLLPEE
jgi:hypothetical protein